MFFDGISRSTTFLALSWKFMKVCKLKIMLLLKNTPDTYHFPIRPQERVGSIRLFWKLHGYMAGVKDLKKASNQKHTQKTIVDSLKVPLCSIYWKNRRHLSCYKKQYGMLPWFFNLNQYFCDFLNMDNKSPTLACQRARLWHSHWALWSLRGVLCHDHAPADWRVPQWLRARAVFDFKRAANCEKTPTKESKR